jgi:hypothetical protein
MAEVHNSSSMAGKKNFLVKFKGKNLHISSLKGMFLMKKTNVKNKIFNFKGQIKSIRGPHLAHGPNALHG